MKTLIITGSTRPVRVGDQITAIVDRILAARGMTTEIVDLRELALPFLDEPLMAATGQYANDHTLQWSRTVADADAIVIVTPQYNFGYPASLKNAIDFLLAEWRGKPGAIISYGAHGGGQSYDQLHQVLSFVGMQLDPLGVRIALSREAYGPDGRLADAEQTVGAYAGEIDALAQRLIAAPGTGERPAPLTPPAAVHAAADAVVAAYNAHDAEAFTVTFAPEGTLIAASGQRLTGRAEIADRYHDLFGDALADAALTETDREVRLLSSSVAHAEIAVSTSSGDAPDISGSLVLDLVYQPGPRTWSVAAGAVHVWARELAATMC